MAESATTIVNAEAGNQLTQTATEAQGALYDAFLSAYNIILAYAPRVVAVAVVLVVGYIVARLVSKGIITLGEKLGLQTTADRGGLTGSMKQVGITGTVPQLVGAISFWLLMWVFVMASCQILGIGDAGNQVQQVLNNVPKLFVATIIVVLGLLLATFLKGVVGTSADRMGLNYAANLAAAVYWVLAVITFHTAATHLGLGMKLFEDAVIALLAGSALAFGLSFGLGGREVMSGILAGYYLRQRLQAGDEVSIAGLEGRVREVGPVATIVETNEDGLLHRHSIPNGKMLTEAVR